MSFVIGDWVSNQMELDRQGVWLLPGHQAFAYSDGRSSETYLERILSRATDLSSDSWELEQGIRDWPSEYHLSRKRAQLLREFDFSRARRVLEVGCGCGAMTRFFGETFHDVVAVEGSLVRARLARLRTRDQENVAVLCAPFQEITYRKSFDIVFCVGVLEYASQFVEASDPYEATLKYFSEVLTPEGVLVLAIENQFGAKYWTSSREDHTGVMFDGLEGYPRFPRAARTFGYGELKKRIDRYFPEAQFYFPFPDYKVPSCVLSEEFIRRVNAGELVSTFRSRDYAGQRWRGLDERRLLLEIDRNDMLPFFANSFLVVAGKKPSAQVTLRSMGVIYSRARVRPLETITRFADRGDGHVQVVKTPASGQEVVEAGPLRLRASASEWIHGLSLQAQVLRRCKERGVTLESLFAPCRAWTEALQARADVEGDRLLVDGNLLDCNWSNCYIVDGKCVFVDHEWEWHEKVSLTVLLVRNAYNLIDVLEDSTDVVPPLRGTSRRPVIARIAQSLGIRTTSRDFVEFRRIQAQIGEVVFGESYARVWLVTWFKLECGWLLVWLRYGKRMVGLIRNVWYRIAKRLA